MGFNGPAQDPISAQPALLLSWGGGTDLVARPCPAAPGRPPTAPGPQGTSRHAAPQEVGGMCTLTGCGVTAAREQHSTLNFNLSSCDHTDVHSLFHFIWLLME